MAKIVNKLAPILKERYVNPGDVLVIDDDAGLLTDEGECIVQAVYHPDRARLFLTFPDTGERWDFNKSFSLDLTVAEIEEMHGFTVIQHVPSSQVKITFERLDS